MIVHDETCSVLGRCENKFLVNEIIGVSIEFLFTQYRATVFKKEIKNCHIYLEIFLFF